MCSLDDGTGQCGHFLESCTLVALVGRLVVGKWPKSHAWRHAQLAPARPSQTGAQQLKDLLKVPWEGGMCESSPVDGWKRPVATGY